LKETISSLESDPVRKEWTELKVKYPSEIKALTEKVSDLEASLSSSP